MQSKRKGTRPHTGTQPTAADEEPIREVGPAPLESCTASLPRGASDSRSPRFRPDEAVHLERQARDAIEKQDRWLSVQARLRELALAHEWFRDAIRQAVLDFAVIRERQVRAVEEWAERSDPGVDSRPPNPASFLPSELCQFTDAEYRTIALYRLGGLADHDNDRPIVPKRERTGSIFADAISLSDEQVRTIPPKEPDHRFAELLCPHLGSFTIERAERMLAEVEKWAEAEESWRRGGEAESPHGVPTGVLPRMHDLTAAAGISNETFRRIRKAAGINVLMKGAAARNRPYPPSEIDRLIDAALAGTFLERYRIAEKWAKWGTVKPQINPKQAPRRR